MSSSVITPDDFALVEVLSQLRREHRALEIGVDDFEAAQRLLHSRSSWTDEELASALASLLARDESSWAAVRVFVQRSIETSSSERHDPPDRAAGDISQRARFSATLMGLAGLAGLVALVLWFTVPDENPPGPDETTGRGVAILGGDDGESATTEAGGKSTGRDDGESATTEVGGTSTERDDGESATTGDDRASTGRDDGEPETTGLAAMRIEEPAQVFEAKALEASVEPEPAPWPSLYWIVVAVALGTLGFVTLSAIQRRRTEHRRDVEANRKERERLDRENDGCGHLYDVDRHPLLPDADIDDAANFLGRREAEGHSQRFDAPGTIRASLRRFGSIVPVYRRLLIQRELVVLVDVEGAGHPMLDVAEHLLDRWRRTGLNLHRYDYKRSIKAGLWTGGRVGVEAARVTLAALRRRHGKARLLVISRLWMTDALALSDAVKGWNMRALLDLYPPIDDGTHNARVQGCEASGLRRFPCVGAGLQAAAAHLCGLPLSNEERDAIQRSVRHQEPSDDAYMLWAAAAATVPNASWAHLEDIRRVLLRSALPAREPLPAVHDAARLVKWLERRYGRVVNATGRTLEFSPDAEGQLLEWLRQRPAGQALETRVRGRLCEQLGRALERFRLSEYEERYIKLKIGLHQAVLDESRVDEILAADAGFHDELAARLRPEYARQVQGLGLKRWRRATLDAVATRVAIAADGGLPQLEVRAVALKNAALWSRVLVAAALAGAVVLLSTSFARLRTTEQVAVELPAIWDLIEQPPPAPWGECVGELDEPATGGVYPAGGHTIEIGDGIRPLEFIALTSGSFTMGSRESEFGHDRNESPRHRVCLSPFEIGVHEVSVAQYEALVHKRPSECAYGCEDEQPVQNVSWDDAIHFVNALTDLANDKRPSDSKLTQCYDEKTRAWDRGCTGYRLPTEAEWEYAARAGSESAYPFGNDPADLCTYGNVMDRRGVKHGVKRDDPPAECDDGYTDLAPMEAARLKPNRWGLHAMHGNVWEWVFDESGGYEKNAVQDPARGWGHAVRT